jgi:hypothetical protein
LFHEEDFIFGDEAEGDGGGFYLSRALLFSSASSVDRIWHSALCRPGDDLLSHVLRQSTIGAEAFDGRVRDGIGSYRLARATRPAKGGRRGGGH